MLLLEFAEKLQSYCGIIGFLVNYSSSGPDTVKRSMTDAVLQCINDIRVHQRIQTLPEFANRLFVLKSAIPEGDQLVWYIKTLQQDVYQKLLSLDQNDFFQETYTALRAIHTVPIDRTIFWQMMDLLTDNAQKQTIIVSLCEKGVLHLLMKDKPLYTMSVLFAALGVNALGYILNVIQDKDHIDLLLDRFRELPPDANRASWMLALSRASTNQGYRESLLSLTLRTAHERFDEVFGNLDALSPEAKTAVLINIYLVICAVNVGSAALYKILLTITKLPATEEVYKLFQQTIKAVCCRPDINSDPTLQQKALFFIDAFFALPEQSLIIRILNMPDTSSDGGYNLINQGIHRSTPLFVRILQFVAKIKEIETRNHFMDLLFEGAKCHHAQSVALIQFALNNPDIQDTWIPYTTKSGWNLLHIAAQRLTLFELVSKLMECIYSKQESDNGLWKQVQRNMLAQQNHIGNTPLMLAAQHSHAAVPPLVTSILQCRDARDILTLANMAGDTALTLVNYSQLQKNMTLICEALRTTSVAPALSSSLSQLWAESSDARKTIQPQDDNSDATDSIKITCT
jgi:hypothetical protein